jgi:hypothetical protein
MTGAFRSDLDEESGHNSIVGRLRPWRVELVLAEALIAVLVLGGVLAAGLLLFWAVAGVIVLGTVPVAIALAL